MVTTRKTGVYHLLLMCPVHIKARIKFSTPQCFVTLSLVTPLYIYIPQHKNELCFAFQKRHNLLITKFNRVSVCIANKHNSHMKVRDNSVLQTLNKQSALNCCFWNDVISKHFFNLFSQACE